MFYNFNISSFPTIHHSYSVSRTTSWQIVDNHNILIFISDGCCEVLYNNETFKLEKGDVFFLPAKQSYIRRPINNTMCTMHYVHFELEEDIMQSDISFLHNSITEIQQRLNTQALSDETVQYPNTIYLENKIRNTKYEELKELFSNINMFSSDRQIMCGLQSQVNLCNILVYLSKKTIAAILTDSNIKNSVSFPVKLKNALAYIEKNYAQKLTLCDVAEKTYVSQWHLSKLLSKHTGQGFSELLNHVRIEHAKELLSDSSLRVGDVAEQVGFSDLAHFSRVFKKQEGVSANEYRNSILGK